ncbi:glycine betaine ABC transporter substrate-binding protein [uncultured Sharpea sp.]|nr:glycine betaine ABC transporter substrate-binding protein [uncultured Sharpea sp.]
MAMSVDGSLLIALLALIVDFIFGRIEKHITNKSHNKKISRITKGVIAVIAAGLIISAIMPSSKKGVIQIATKPMTEQYIIGEMLKQAIESQSDLKVKLTQGVGGGTSNIEPGMESGKFDLYPEYTGTGWNMVLKRKDFYQEDKFNTLQKEYENKLHLTWHTMLGFNDTFGIALRKDIADQYQIKTYSDLQKLNGQLVLGAEYDFFERQDGYDQLVKTYNLSFKSTSDMDMGLKYQALNSGKIDIMPVNTTDGQLASSRAVLLKDDLHMYPSYQCGLVVREDTLKKYPELGKALKKFDHILSEESMQHMNYQVETEKKEASAVAKVFLKEKQLLK